MEFSSRYEDHTRLPSGHLTSYHSDVMCLLGCANKAIEVKRSSFVDKEEQRNHAETPYQPGYLSTFMTGSFRFKLSANFNIALKSMHTTPYIVLSSFDIKMVIKVNT